MLNRARGSLFGGAVGDALGYAVEFMSLNAILKQYGNQGITKYDLGGDGAAEFSDDTQMSLFTAEGLLNAVAAGKKTPKDTLPFIEDAYMTWYHTQTRHPFKSPTSWLSSVEALWSQRAPGNTCMSALSALGRGPVINNSKGCGGVMRVAPIGIYSAAHPLEMPLEEAGYLAAYASDVTHKHPLSTYSSMALAMIVADCMAHDNVDREKFRFIVIDRVLKLIGISHRDSDFHHLKALLQKALDLAVSDTSDFDAIRQLGEGWVAEETLAIAVFSVMRYIDDFEKCVVCSVNHDGDSDSTGAVAGNIIGAILGYEAIPQKFKSALEVHDVILSMAADLCGMSSPEQMHMRYGEHLPVGVPANYLIEE